MKRLAFVVVVLAACDPVAQVAPGPPDQFYRPTGIGVYAGKLVVASSNSDLRFDDETGGTVIAVDADPLLPSPRLTGTLPINSYAGLMAIADPAQCPAMLDPAAGALALVPVRGQDLLYAVRVRADGALSCDGCGLPVSSTQTADAFAVGVACGPGLARAFVGYLRSNLGQTYVTQVDLARSPTDPRAVQTRALSTIGQVRAFAFDAESRRLYFTKSVSSAATSLDWIELDGCELAPEPGETGCPTGATAPGAIPQGLELRGIALSSSSVPHRRVYLTAKIYDPVAAATAGVRVGDFDGVLLVADLVENLTGGLGLRIVRQVSLGFGAADVIRLPAVAARAGLRDVVVAVTAEGVVSIYDDETGDVRVFGRDALGKPQLGRSPFGLAVDGAPPPDATVAQVYVGSFDESFVTRIEVPFASPAAAQIDPDRITGGTP